MTELTPSQSARLAAARAARREATRVALPSQQKFAVDRSAYRRNLQASMQADSEKVKEQASSIRQRSIQEWEERVGMRWAHAQSNDPAVIDRVERMKTGQGTHKTSLLGIGPMGSGKTWSAYGYAGELVRQGVITSPQIQIAKEAAIASISTSGFNAAARMAEILNPQHKLFIFDDVGQANFSSAISRQGIWHEILDHIYSNRLAMVMTTNLSIQKPQGMRDAAGKVVDKTEFEIWLGDAAFSRLKTLIGDDGIIVPGNEDMRQKVFQDWEQQYRQNRI